MWFYFKKSIFAYLYILFQFLQVFIICTLSFKSQVKHHNLFYLYIIVFLKCIIIIFIFLEFIIFIVKYLYFHICSEITSETEDLCILLLHFLYWYNFII